MPMKANLHGARNNCINDSQNCEETRYTRSRKNFDIKL
jgi:hypothetical protein